MKDWTQSDPTRPDPMKKWNRSDPIGPEKIQYFKVHAALLASSYVGQMGQTNKQTKNLVRFGWFRFSLIKVYRVAAQLKIFSPFLHGVFAAVLAIFF